MSDTTHLSLKIQEFMLMFTPEKKNRTGAYTLKCACLKRCPTLKIVANPTYFATPI